VSGNGKKARYQGYNLVDQGGEPVDAAARFEAKYGYAPAEVRRMGGGWLAGPILEGDRGRGIPETAQNAAGRPCEARSGLLRRAEAAQRPIPPERARQLALSLEV
jgi:hypothetical protein